MKNKILLFIPGYNCEAQITRVLNQIDENVSKFIDEIIVVNNQSTDNTEKIVLNYLKNSNLNLNLLRNKENYGLGGSHKVAFKYAIENNFDYLIVLHGDDQGNIQDIMPILQQGIHQKYDACLGARFMKGSQLKGYSKFRTIGNKVYNLIFSLILGNSVKDLGSGLNIYSTKILKDNFYVKFEDNLTFNCYMLLAAKQYTHRVHYFPISWREEDQISNVKMVSQAFNTLELLFKYKINPKKYILSETRKIARNDYSAYKVNDKL